MGLTGANGSGKSSLFAVIAGRLDADQGNVTLPKGTLITEVLQETPNSTRTAIDYVIDGDQSYRSLELKITQAELDDDGTLLATLHSQMGDIDGFSSLSPRRTTAARIRLYCNRTKPERGYVFWRLAHAP